MPYTRDLENNTVCIIITIILAEQKELSCVDQP